jgi:integral membrane protein (TIGR01906 family)
MPRAPWPLGLLFGSALVVVIGLLGPLALFNPWFTSVLQQRHAVATELGAAQADVERLTADYLTDIYAGGSFDASLGDAAEPFLDASERAHMRDVSGLVRTMAAVLVAALLVALGTAAWMRREPRRIGRTMLVAAATVGTVAIGLGLAFAVAFDAAFTAFHELFFAPGTWQFELGSNLITLFPEPFWFDAALLAGASILVVAALVSVVGYRAWREGRAPSASA